VYAVPSWREQLCQRHETEVLALRFSPKGDCLVVAGSGGKATVYGTKDCKSWHLIKTLDHKFEAVALNFAPDSSYLAVGDMGCMLTFYSLPHGTW